MAYDYDRYIESVADDVYEALPDYVDPKAYDDYDAFYEECDQYYGDLELSCTGNDNGSYFCNSRRAAAFIGEAVWDYDLVLEMRDLYGDHLPDDPESWDVVARLAMFGQAWIKALERYEDEFGKR